MRIERFEDIKAWQEARKLVKEVYRVCCVKAFNNDYSLMDQIRRASVSIMANIAEGFSRQGNKEFVQFLFIAKSSAAEVQSHLYVALDQCYIQREDFGQLSESLEKTQRQISNFIKYLKGTFTKKTQ